MTTDRALEQSPSVRQIGLGISCAFIALGLVAYARVVPSFFLSDDFGVLAAVSRNGPFGIWADRQSIFFRPLASLSFFVDLKMWGLNAAGFHLTNIVLHGLNGCLCAGITATLLSRHAWNTRVVVALAAGSFFILSPSHAESVAWISGRTDVLATLFVLVGFLVYLRAARYGHTTLHFILVLTLYLCALLSKETTIIFPLLVAVHWRPSTPGESVEVRTRRLWLGGLAVVAGLYLLLRRVVIGQLVGGYGLLSDPTRWAEKPFIFMARSVVPAGGWTTAMWIGGGLWVVLIGTIVSPLREGTLHSPKGSSQSVVTGLRTTAALAIAAQAVILLGLNLEVSTVDSQGERFVYLSSAFTSMFIGMAAGLLAVRTGWRSLILLCPLLLGVSFSLQQANEHWRIAGRVSQSVVASLEANIRRGDALVLNAPDNVMGAYVFRNGLSQAVELFATDDRTRMYGPLVYQALNGPADRVGLTREEGILSLTLLDGGRWMGRNGSMVLPHDVAQELGSDQAHLTIKTSALQERNRAVLYYSAGRMERVPAVVERR